MYSGVAQPLSFDTFGGLVWLAVVVTLGVRSIASAALAGLAFALLPAVFSSYVPTRWGEVPAILFGLGAIGVAQHPEGAVLQNGRQLRSLIARALSGANTRKGVPDSGRGGAGSPVAHAGVGAEAER
jgi:branched-chain amino acid transport system permease protein